MNELYEHLPSVEGFLERIGLEGFTPAIDLESLDILIKAFLTHIPYENLEVSFEHKIPSLAPAGLYDKLVTRRRGGYCFEMNGAMWALLRDIGFEVYSVVAFVTKNARENWVPTHRGNIVTLDGEKFYVDVGYGSSPIMLAVPFGAPRGGYYFYVNEIGEHYLRRVVEPDDVHDFGQIILENEDGTKYKNVIMFRDYRAYPQEFAITNEWAAASQHPMAINRVCNLQTPEGNIYKIFGDSFKWKTAGGSGERTIESDDDFKEIAAEYFGIEL